MSPTGGNDWARRNDDWASCDDSVLVSIAEYGLAEFSVLSQPIEMKITNSIAWYIKAKFFKIIILLLIYMMNNLYHCKVFRQYMLSDNFQQVSFDREYKDIFLFENKVKIP